MDIVLSSDENYVAHLATTIVSTIINNKDSYIRFHILDGGISEDSYLKIKSLESKFHRIIVQFYKIDSNYIKERFSVPSLYNDRSLATYSRLFIPELLDSEIERAVYLDIDAVVTGNLSELFSMNMNYPIYGVKDINNPSHRLAVGLNTNDNYVCAGMLLIDIVRCRKMKIVDSFINFVRLYDGNVKAMDQGTINGTLNGNVGLLHPKYDVLTPFYTLNEHELCLMGGWKEYYSQKELNEAIQNPVFIHFTPNLSTRPWQKHCKHPMKSEYIKYRNMTPFPIKKFNPDNRKLYLKCLGLLYYHLPYKTYEYIYNILCKVFK